MPQRAGDPVSLIADTYVARQELGFDPKKSLSEIVMSCL
jgi:UDP-glucose 4-epimerase